MPKVGGPPSSVAASRRGSLSLLHPLSTSVNASLWRQHIFNTQLSSVDCSSGHGTTVSIPRSGVSHGRRVSRIDSPQHGHVHFSHDYV